MSNAAVLLCVIIGWALGLWAALTVFEKWTLRLQPHTVGFLTVICGCLFAACMLVVLS